VTRTSRFHSNWSAFGFMQLLDEPPERVAALLEVRELVVARARRREEDDVPGSASAAARATAVGGPRATYARPRLVERGGELSSRRR
jgi:hypothetical protein